MPDVEFTFLADQDIENIVRYTVDQWGTEQARRYISALDKHLQKDWLSHV